MKRLFFVFALSLSTNLAANNVVVVNKQPYKLVPIEKKSCDQSTIDGKGYFKIVFEFGLAAEKFDCRFKCGDNQNCASECDTDPAKVRQQQIKGLDAVFSGIREFPPYFEGCEALRDDCAHECAKVGAVPQKVCATECFQYESYNKKDQSK